MNMSLLAGVVHFMSGETGIESILPNLGALALLLYLVIFYVPPFIWCYPLKLWFPQFASSSVNTNKFIRRQCIAFITTQD